MKHTRTLRTRWQVVALCAGLLLGSGAVRADVIALDQSALQHQVNKLFPLTQDLPAISLRLHDPEVSLSSASDRLRLRVQIDARAVGIDPQAGDIVLSGKPRFVRSEQALYISEPAVEHLGFSGIDPLYHPAVRSLASSLIEAMLALYPVYVVRDDRLASLGELTDVRIEDGQVLLELEPR